MVQENVKKTNHDTTIVLRSDNIDIQPTTDDDSDGSDYEGSVDDEASGSEYVCVHALPEPPYTPAAKPARRRLATDDNRRHSQRL